MASKREFVNYSNSVDLKNALMAKGLYPAMDTYQDYYDGSGNDIHLTHGQHPSGAFRTVNITSQGVSSDFILPSDSGLVRRFMKLEMDYLLDTIGGVESSINEPSGQNFIHTIIRNGIIYTGTGSSIPNSMAKCIINLVNAI